MKIIRIILGVITVGLVELYACALCGNLTQMVHTTVHESHTDDEMKLDIEWKFTKAFSAETLIDYDSNGNKMLDKSEIATVQQMLIDYLQKENYLTHIKYVPSVEAYDTMPYLPHTATNTRTEFKDNILHFFFTLETKLKPKDGYFLYLTFFDKGAFFLFRVNSIEQEIKQEENSTVIMDSSASFSLGKSQGEKSALATIAPKNEHTHSPQSAILGWLSVQLKETKERLIHLLEDIKENQNISSYFWLLLFSLLYGMIHALGPGHGKSLVAAYFLSNNRSVSKAFTVSALIGVVHTFSAFVLTFVIYYVLNTYMGHYFSNIESVTTKISAVIIIMIALYLLYKRIPKRPKPVVQKVAVGGWSQSKPVATHQHSCGCGACQTQSTDIGVILSAGIVPCPGTITIFIFTLSLGVYSVGLMSAIFMSLGMSLIIFIAAYLSLKVRENSSPNERVRQVLDYGSLVFILGLGVLLFLAT